MESEGESEETPFSFAKRFSYIRTLRSGVQTVVEPKMARSQKMPIIVQASIRNHDCASGLHLPTHEFFPRCSEVTEMVNGHPHRRESERLELFVEHPL